MRAYALIITILYFGLFGLSVNCEARARTSIPNEVILYQHHVNELSNTAETSSLESLFKEGLSAAAILKNRLESFDDSTFEEASQRMVGFLISREEVLVVAPDPDFFITLAQKKGKESDKAFFQALKKTYPNGVWPSYIEQQTDIGGCTKLGDGTLINLYKTWVEFRENYPNRYRSNSQRQIDKIEVALESTCACKDEGSVQNEMKKFVESYPSSHVGDKAKELLHLIKRHKIKINSYCAAG